VVDGFDGADGGEDVTGLGFFAAGDGEGGGTSGVFWTGGGQLGRVENLGCRRNRWDRARGCFLRPRERWLAGGRLSGKEVKQRRLIP
jgi:hypothetical protein